MKTLVHRFWVGPPPADHGWVTRTVQQACPNADVADWTLETLPPALARVLIPGDDPRHVANVVRYWLLHEYGGLWLDHDVIPLHDLTGRTRPWTASLRGQREGSAMWFPNPGHPMLAQLLAIVQTTPAALESPARSGGLHLREVGSRYPDVGLEERVLPVDSAGRGNAAGGEVWAVHLWRRSATRHTAHSQPAPAGAR